MALSTSYKIPLFNGDGRINDELWEIKFLGLMRLRGLSHIFNDSSATNEPSLIDQYKTLMHSQSSFNAWKTHISLVIRNARDDRKKALDILSFKTLFEKYHAEVYPAKLVFVSFLHSQHAEGEMISELENYNHIQLRLSKDRPNLSKLDDLFGQLSTSTTTFEGDLKAAEVEAKKNGIAKLFEGLDIKEA